MQYLTFNFSLLVFLNCVFLFFPCRTLISGVLPFGAVFIELFFILTAIWEKHFYYMFGFLFIVFIILIISCSQISIVMVYFQLCGEVSYWRVLSLVFAFYEIEIREKKYNAQNCIYSNDVLLAKCGPWAVKQNLRRSEQIQRMRKNASVHLETLTQIKQSKYTVWIKCTLLSLKSPWASKDKIQPNDLSFNLNK